MAIITIFSTLYCSERKIIAKLAKKLDYSILDRNLIEETLMHLKREDGLSVSGNIEFEWEVVYDKDGIKVIELIVAQIDIAKNGK